MRHLLEAIPADKRTYQPTPQHRAVYDHRYEVFVEIYCQMKGVYRRLNQ